jgi:hypothetical protein
MRKILVSLVLLGMLLGSSVVFAGGAFSMDKVAPKPGSSSR